MNRLLHLAIVLSLPSLTVLGQTNLNDVPTFLTVPKTEQIAPAAAHRVVSVTEGWQGTEVHHALYLPVDWKPGVSMPVIVEYPGNGGYKSKLGDVSDGSVEGCMLGYGLSAGKGLIWVSMPYVEIVDGKKRNAAKWWGDVEETKRYCMATVKNVCARYGGDAKRVVLMGFSRGAIGCNYIGLHDDEIAKLWCGMLCHSHYEGEFKHPAADEKEWPQRLQRLAGRPQFISQENGTAKTEAAIAGTGVKGAFTFATLPYANHSARWTLCDIPLRTQAVGWLQRVVKVSP